ncbi:MAG: hypothetical protein PS018_21220 [bacterium]|nr:hypothetical protein [bacterium]
MRNEFPVLNDAELETVSAGGSAGSTDTRPAGNSPDTSVSRVKTSDEHHAAMLAFIKG